MMDLLRILAAIDVIAFLAFGVIMLVSGRAMHHRG